MFISSTISFPLSRTQPLNHTTSRNIACMSTSSCNNTPTMRKTTNLYETLRVSHNASLKEIKTAYRALAKTYHPDVLVRHKKRHRHAEDDDGGQGPQGQEQEREFVEICNAYATLSDSMARAVYDMSLGLSGVIRRRPGGENGHGLLFSQTRRWESDQCW